MQVKTPACPARRSRRHNPDAEEFESVEAGFNETIDTPIPVCKYMCKVELLSVEKLETKNLNFLLC